PARAHAPQRVARAAARAPSAPGEASMPGPSGLEAGLWMNPAYLPCESDPRETRTPPGRTVLASPATPDSLSRAVNSTWQTTGALQGFYGAEFSHALDCAGGRLELLRGERLSEALAANFRTLMVSAGTGTGVRFLRDILSLAVSVPMTVGVVKQMVADTPATEALSFDSFNRANLPFGNLAASYGLMGAELIKA